MYIKLPGFGQSDPWEWEVDRSELWVSDLDGTHQIKLASSSGLLMTGDWSHDDTQLAFVDKVGGGSKGFIVVADGRGLRQIAPVDGEIASLVWSTDDKSLSLGVAWGHSLSIYSLWKASSDGSNVQKLLDGCGLVIDIAPDGKYLLSTQWLGAGVGIYAISLPDNKCTLMLPGVPTLVTRFAPDGKSFLYALSSNSGVTFYRQAWSDGKTIGQPQIALKLPFVFGQYYFGNVYDFSRDLSTIVYARPGGQAELYLLSQPQ
jgi:Tol biopolymer transport system component